VTHPARSVAAGRSGYRHRGPTSPHEPQDPEHAVTAQPSPPPPTFASGGVTPLGDVRAQALEADRHRRVIRTGYVALDRALVGGIRTQNLTVIGGRPGAGKTVALLQWARTMALAGETVLIACYEHDERTLMDRLLLMELGELAEEVAYGELASAREGLRDVAAGVRLLEDVIDGEPALQEASERMGRYEQGILFVRTSATRTTVQELESLCTANEATVLMVDYLQKVPTDPWLDDDRVRAMMVAQGLKDLAMRRDVAVVTIAIADRRGLDAARLRTKHLEGSSTITYEADAVMLLNPKYDIVHRNHIVYDPEKAKAFHRWTVWTIEKHRDGADAIDIQLEKDFRHYRFHPVGADVLEQLIDERHDSV
jgi:replicative DNA helicase